MVQTKEELAAYMKAWHKKNKIKTAEQKKVYYETNKQHIAEVSKIYHDNNKEKLAVKAKIYYQTPIGIKSGIFNAWKRSGLIHDNFDTLYESYLQSTHCDVCKCEFKDTFDRCMDHDHNTNLFRQFLCRRCNCNDHWKTLI
jgi:hypothetical protein